MDAGNPEPWQEQARKAEAQNLSTVVNPTVNSPQIVATSTLGDVLGFPLRVLHSELVPSDLEEDLRGKTRPGNLRPPKVSAVG